ncbi:MAG TPA: efflux RND transporter periplasmic adaptor subunit [Alphaproteobacteria bacterium]|nr:efflux RND transporter periplasmic adaptor subunit [Alphaproteobacteria bacterium]
MNISYRLLFALATALSSLFLIAASPDASGPSVLVQMTKVKEGTLPQTVQAYGTVQADTFARTTVTAPLAAKVGNVFVRLGEELPKGAKLMRLVPNPQTSASYTQAVSALQNATALVAHTRELYKQYLATKQELADAKKAEADARAALAALKMQGAQGPKTLTTPFAAIVTKISASAGSTVTVGTPLLDLAPPNSLVLRVGVVPGRAREINSGDKAKITPVGETKPIEGKVMLRGSMVETGNGLVPIEITLPPGALLPGQTAEAAITAGMVKGYIVPHSAILVDDSGRPYVVQARNMKATFVYVHVLAMNGDEDLVDGELDLAAPLVVAGNHQLQEGMKVRLADPLDKRNP